MKTQTAAFVIITALAAMAATQPAAAADSERRINATGFKGVSLEGSMNVVIDQAPNTLVIAKGSYEALEELDIKVDDGVLRLRQKDRKGVRVTTKNQRVTILIRMPALDSFSLAGAGNVTLNNLKANKLDIDIAGSGNVSATGTCNELEIDIAGSGDITAQNFKCRKVSISVAGSGDASVYADSSFSANIMGSGDINVYGNPKARSKRVLGGGKIVYHPTSK